MEQELYRVVFDSREIDRRHRRRTKRILARQFKLNRKKLNRLFSDKPAVIKRGICFERAVRLKVAIERAGGVCTIRRMKPATPRLLPVLSDVVHTGKNDVTKKTVSWVDLAMDTSQANTRKQLSSRKPDDAPKILRQPHDRRSEQDRRRAIRLQEDRRSDNDRRADKQVWVNSQVQPCLFPGTPINDRKNRP